MSADTLPVTAWVLKEQRRGLVLWTIALAAVTAIYVAFWPAMGEGAEMQAFIDNMPEGLVSAMGYDRIGTPAGYLESTVFGLLAPILLLVFGIAGGARLVAGDEETGALELESTAPIARRTVLLQRFSALAVSLLVLTVTVFVVTVALAAALDMEVGVHEILAATAGLFLLALGCATIALAVGAVTGRRAAALGVAAAVATVGFVADALSGMLDDGRWLEVISPFSWYLGPDPLTNGWDLPSLVWLGLLTVIPLAVAWVVYDRRDLGV
jgi:ABC-2 type transport system permease protein